MSSSLPFGGATLPDLVRLGFFDPPPTPGPARRSDRQRLSGLLGTADEDLMRRAFRAFDRPGCRRLMGGFTVDQLLEAVRRRRAAAAGPQPQPHERDQ
jgi:hypothetical protein